LGEKGTVEIGGFAVNEMKVWNFIDQRAEDSEVLSQYHENPPNVYGFGHAAYIDHVVRTIHSGGRALVDGLEGRKSLELIVAIYESIASGRDVQIRFRPRHTRLGDKNGSASRANDRRNGH
jgi:predicted dehydrogenase